jgi:hypothetical protein
MSKLRFRSTEKHWKMNTTYSLDYHYYISDSDNIRNDLAKQYNITLAGTVA